MKTILLTIYLLIFVKLTSPAQCPTNVVYIKPLGGSGITSLFIEPDMGSKSIIDLKYGDTLSLLDCEHEIYYKVSFKNTIGYISKNYVSENQLIDKDYDPKKHNLVKTKSKFNNIKAFPVKSSPKPDAKILFYIPLDSAISIIDSKDGYYLVEYNNNKGYLSDLYVEKSNLKTGDYNSSGTYNDSNNIHIGPRNGEYFINSKGKKTYLSSIKSGKSNTSKSRKSSASSRKKK
jgi:hypothetical protein